MRWASGIVMVLGLGLLAGPAGAAESAPWIHIQVSDAKDADSDVNINLPLNLASMALAMVKDDDLKQGHVTVEGQRMSVAELRTLWQQLSKAEDGDFLTIERDQAIVRLARRDERVLVVVSERDTGRRTVRLNVPVPVVDALLAGEAEHLNVQAAVEALKLAPRGDLVTVDDIDSQVRVWID